ncbi:unnamed protein product [Spirodela intermedia]|nr:unnamed protein product [Spirodela intermedia]CAA6653612.1 unnamed protein product [Spirodela intermedia]
MREGRENHRSTGVRQHHHNHHHHHQAAPSPRWFSLPDLVHPSRPLHAPAFLHHQPGVDRDGAPSLPADSSWPENSAIRSNGDDDDVVDTSLHL